MKLLNMILNSHTYYTGMWFSYNTSPSCSLILNGVNWKQIEPFIVFHMIEEYFSSEKAG